MAAGGSLSLAGDFSGSVLMNVAGEEDSYFCGSKRLIWNNNIYYI